MYCMQHSHILSDFTSVAGRLCLPIKFEIEVSSIMRHRRMKDRKNPAFLQTREALVDAHYRDYTCFFTNSRG